MVKAGISKIPGQKKGKVGVVLLIYLLPSTRDFTIPAQTKIKISLPIGDLPYLELF